MGEGGGGDVIVLVVAAIGRFLPDCVVVMMVVVMVSTYVVDLPYANSTVNNQSPYYIVLNVSLTWRWPSIIGLYFLIDFNKNNLFF